MVWHPAPLAGHPNAGAWHPEGQTPPAGALAGAGAGAGAGPGAGGTAGSASAAAAVPPGHNDISSDDTSSDEEDVVFVNAAAAPTAAPTAAASPSGHNDTSSDDTSSDEEDVVFVNAAAAPTAAPRVVMGSGNNSTMLYDSDHTTSDSDVTPSADNHADADADADTDADANNEVVELTYDQLDAMRLQLQLQDTNRDKANKQDENWVPPINTFVLETKGPHRGKVLRVVKVGGKKNGTLKCYHTTCETVMWRRRADGWKFLKCFNFKEDATKKMVTITAKGGTGLASRLREIATARVSDVYPHCTVEESTPIID
jgi:hypothetical protein